MRCIEHVEIKRALCIVLLLSALSATLAAQEDFFPLGAWVYNARYEYGAERNFVVMDSAKACGFNLVQISYMHETGSDPMLSTALQHVKDIGLKCFIMAAAPRFSASQPPKDYLRHNLTNFSGGIYQRYQANHPYFSGHTVGHVSGTDIVCELGEIGYALLLDSLAYIHNWDSYKPWKYRNNIDCRMPFVDTNNLWYHSPSVYTVNFRVKYQNTNSSDTTHDSVAVPICKIGWQRFEENWGPNSLVVKDSIYRDLTTNDFAGPNQYKVFSISFTRNMTQSRFIDFPVSTYGNKRLIVDYVEFSDAVYDSLIHPEYLVPGLNQNFSQIINNIANTYSDTSVVYRYFLYDEPVRSQLDAYYRVDQRLLGVGNNIPAFTNVSQHYPGGCGRLGLSEHADTSYYAEFVNAASPAQLEIDILPLFGDSGRIHDALPWVNSAGQTMYYTPFDSGWVFQRQMDVLCRYARCANSASRNAPGGAIPWWLQLQCWSDSLCNSSSGQNTIGCTWRMPTPRELECMAWLGLAHGAKGLHYFVLAGGVGNYAGYTQEDLWVKQDGILGTRGEIRDINIYNTVKQLNREVTALAPLLLKLDCDISFRKQNGAVPSGQFITGISDSLVQCGIFHHKTIAGDKYFMLVNRHCLPSDSLTVTVKINYPTGPFFVCDMLTGRDVSGQLAAGTNVPFSYTLQPGEGRLFRIKPFASAPKNRTRRTPIQR